MTPLPDRQQLFAAMGAAHPRGGRDGKKSVVILFDINNGKQALQHRFDKQVSAAAISPSGTRVATVEEGGFGERAKTLDIWNFGQAELERADSWNPHAKEFFKEVKAVEWIDDNRLITANFKSVLIWDVDTRRLLWKIEGGGSNGYALSHNRKQLAVASGKGIIVVDLASGEVVQRVEPPESRHYGRIAFCPSGQLLAASHGSGAQLDLINLETGELFDTLNLQSNSRENVGFFWPDNEHVLIGGRDLVHVPSKVIVWLYQHLASEVVYSHGHCWYLLKGDLGSVFPAAL